MVGAVGSGSGIDINAMVSKIVESEKTPKQEKIIKNKNEIETEISAFGRLKGAMDAMKEVMANFRRNEVYAARITTSDNEAVTALASSQAVTGVYSIAVEQLATSQKLISPIFDPNTTFGEGQLMIAMGSQQVEIELDPNKSSLVDMVRAINNKASKIGIHASILQDEKGPRLLIGSNKTGKDNQITIKAKSPYINSTLSKLNYQPGGLNNSMVEMQAATDSTMMIDGLIKASSDNTVFDDAISGVTLTVSDVTEQPAIITVKEDGAAVKAALEDFVDKYNAFYQIAKAVSDPRDAKNEKESSDVIAPLAGDSVVRAAVNQLRKLFSTPINSASGSFNSLSELGITTTQSGRLEINQKLLDKQIQQNFAGLSAFFGGEDGFARQLEKVVENFTSAGGAIRNRETTLDERKIKLKDDQENLDRRMASLEKRTMRQFTAMDNAVAEMNSQLSSMNNILSGAGL